MRQRCATCAPLTGGLLRRSSLIIAYSHCKPRYRHEEGSCPAELASTPARGCSAAMIPALPAKPLQLDSKARASRSRITPTMKPATRAAKQDEARAETDEGAEADIYAAGQCTHNWRRWITPRSSASEDEARICQGCLGELNRFLLREAVVNLKMSRVAVSAACFSNLGSGFC